jgi:DNA repair exonuclease SbcCD ATPase subunit
MKEELIYTILELEEWNLGSICCFCPGLNESICQIRTRNKITHRIVENDYACESCREKFENDELPKCEDCGRLKTQLNINSLSGKYICNCLRNNESKEKSLPILPHEERASTRYERQINGLQEEKNQLTEEVETHLEALEVAEDWHKRQKQELLDRIKELEKENKQLKGLTNQELINELNSCREKIKVLEEQNGQLMAQIEVPPKDKGIKGFFKFGGKK